MPAATAILIYENGAPRDKQEAACLRYCAEHGYEFKTLVTTASDALKLVRTGEVDVIVAAYTPASEDGLASEVEAAGGRIERARGGRRHVREVGKVVLRLFDRGMTVREISEVVDMETGEVRAELHRRRRDYK